jgi:hypothetical protein
MYMSSGWLWGKITPILMATNGGLTITNRIVMRINWNIVGEPPQRLFNCSFFGDFVATKLGGSLRAWKNNVQYVMHIRFDPINIPFYPIHIKYAISLQ